MLSKLEVEIHQNLKLLFVFHNLLKILQFLDFQVKLSNYYHHILLLLL